MTNWRAQYDGRALIGNYDYADDLTFTYATRKHEGRLYRSEASIVLSNLDAESFYYVIPVYDAEDEMITDLFITLTDGETLTETRLSKQAAQAGREAPDFPGASFFIT